MQLQNYNGGGAGVSPGPPVLRPLQPDIDKINLYAKYPYEVKTQYLINKREKVGLNHFNDTKALIEYSNNM